MNQVAVKSGLSLANKITIGRILGIPVFVFLLIYYTLGLQHGDANESYRFSALAVFVLVALTDALDGFVARLRGEITLLGRILDPLADKALLLSGLILLTQPSIPGLKPFIPIGFTLLVISRDVLLVFGVFIVNSFVGHVDVRPRVLGKIATFFQMVTIFWVLMKWPPQHFIWVLAPAFFFTLVSGLIYLFDGIRQLERGVASHSSQPPQSPHA